MRLDYMIHTQNQMFKQGTTKPIRNFFTQASGSCHNLSKVIKVPICCCLLFSGASLITVLFRSYSSTNPLTLLTDIKGHIVAKWVPKPNLIMKALTALSTQFGFPRCNAQLEIKHTKLHTLAM